MEVSSAFLERAAQSHRWLPNSNAAPVGEERPYGLCRLCAGPRLATSSVPAPVAFVARLSPQDFGGVMGWKMNNDLRDEFVLSEEGLRVADLTLSSATI